MSEEHTADAASVLDFLKWIQEWAQKYPDYKVVICNCTKCHVKTPARSDDWAINHSEKRIYL
jgi:hypothetical protein